MAHICYSYESWWSTISNISTYQFIWNKIRNAPFNLWRNLSWGYISSSAFYSAVCDYIIMTGMTVVYFALLKGASLIWQLWMIVTSFYWWIKAIYLFTLGDKSWRRPIPREAILRKRPRRALRKMHPGVSRTKLCQLAQIYQPPTHEENSFRASIQQR